ncbi:hypothetical protein A9R05_11910 [Burkholderia sp. KK1]|nr:hypothetical protein A9R05_11910 [Burkholderia sp. KK1]
MNCVCVSSRVGSAPLYLTNNGTGETIHWAALAAEAQMEMTLIEGQGNVGYGYNLSIERTSSLTVWMLNPDLERAGDALRHPLSHPLAFMGAHAEFGLRSPLIVCHCFMLLRSSALFHLFRRLRSVPAHARRGARGLHAVEVGAASWRRRGRQRTRM